MAASGGYPGSYETGLPIDLDGAPNEHAGSGRAIVFHAGTRREGDRLVTSGGRVLAVTGVGPDPTAARDAAYARLRRISFPGMFFRSDIGRRAAAG